MSCEDIKHQQFENIIMESFTLSYNNFSCLASQSFKSLLNDPNYIDVRLVTADDKQFNAHKIILSTVPHTKCVHKIMLWKEILFVVTTCFKKYQFMLIKWKLYWFQLNFMWLLN